MTDSSNKKSVRVTLSARDIRVITDALQASEESIIRDIGQEYDDLAIYKELAADLADTKALFSKMVSLR